MSKGIQYAIALSILALSAIGVLAGLYISLHLNEPIEVDADLCPLKSPAKGHVVVVVDWTDPFTEQQRSALRSIVHRLKQDLAVHERLSLFVITGVPEDSATPKFSICKPLDVDNINPWIANERRLKDKWSEQFGKPLDDKLAELLQGSTAPHSPILEAIDVIMWSPNFQSDLPHRQLIVFSDLLQNWPGHNHYQKIPQPCDLLKTPLGEKFKARNWNGLSVVFHYWRNPRDSHLQGPQHFKFWTEIFSLFGVRDVRDGPNRTEISTSCNVTGSVPPAPAPKPARAKRAHKQDDGWLTLFSPGPSSKK